MAKYSDPRSHRLRCCDGKVTATLQSCDTHSQVGPLSVQRRPCSGRDRAFHPSVASRESPRANAAAKKPIRNTSSDRIYRIEAERRTTAAKQPCRGERSESINKMEMHSRAFVSFCPFRDCLACSRTSRPSGLLQSKQAASRVPKRRCSVQIASAFSCRILSILSKNLAQSRLG
jgi:hypothetical protein